MVLKRNIFFLFIPFLFLITGCREPSPVNVGFIAPLTGSYSHMGLEAKDGITMAMDEYNSEISKKERPVHITFSDDGNSEETTRREIDSLIEEGNEFIIGPMTSTMTLIALDQIGEQDVMVISPTASTTELSGKKDNFFRLAEANQTEGIHLSQFAYNILNLKKMAIGYDISNLEFTTGLSNYLISDYTKLGGTIKSMIGLDREIKESHLDTARLLIESEPDVIVLIMTGFDAALVCQKIRQLDREVKIILTTWAKDADLLANGGKAVEGAIFIEMFRFDSGIPRFNRFRENFIEIYGYEPGFASLLAYESFLLLSKGIVPGASNKEIKENIRQIRTLEGLQGMLYFDEYGDILRDHFFGVVEKGEFTYLEE